MQILNISKNEDPTAFLDNMYQCLITLSKISFVLCFNHSSLFPFVTSASCPVTGHHWEEDHSVFCTLFYLHRRCSLSCWTLPAASPALCTSVPLLQSLENICAPLLMLFQGVHVFLAVKSSELELGLQVSFSSAEQTGAITFLYF